MIIRKYGLMLKRVELQDIEMLRTWRNDPKIRKHMFFQATISEKMQQEWYESISNNQNYYFIIYADDAACGLISISSIDFDNKNAFAGLFIYDDKYLGTDVPVRSSLIILDIFYSFTNLESMYAKVRDSNIVAHLYNTSLGFKRIKKIELGKGYEYCLKRENYYQSTTVLHTAVQRLYGDKTIIEFDQGNPEEMILKESFMSALAADNIPAGLTVI